MIGRDAAAVVGDLDDRMLPWGLTLTVIFPVGSPVEESVACSGIQQQVEQHLVDLIAVVLDFGQGWVFVQFDLDWI